ncbi:hypothetical protein L202_06289 [Cryptococcus amylolentus CBS 6039]|uniref:Pentacotripeptide-repeat region of PRORP domain-containing protein n=1 Tax=Cryptococcus amylolentus CBS 6039 TaxID=1295533 RepID=A0A1E3HI33_9TREE|nr:hypothetical protein L202_06289 [Cryptococcus amylolentus CBS 6039]ODN75071.1 hypothetical protein L202_06289 [Cryptococcus amylolentus CBS 6039]
MPPPRLHQIFPPSSLAHHVFRLVSNGYIGESSAQGATAALRECALRRQGRVGICERPAGSMMSPSANRPMRSYSTTARAASSGQWSPLGGSIMRRRGVIRSLEPRMGSMALPKDRIRLYSSSAAQTVDNQPPSHSEDIDQQGEEPELERFIASASEVEDNSLPPPLHAALASGSLTSASEFVHLFEQYDADDSPAAGKVKKGKGKGVSSTSDMGGVKQLGLIFDLFRKTAEDAQWAWLERRMRKVLDSNYTPAQGIATAIRGYALFELGTHGPQVIDVLQGVLPSNNSLPHAIAGLVYAQLGEWHLAREEMSRNLKIVFALIMGEDMQIEPYPAIDRRLLYLYESAVLKGGRNHDLVDIILYSASPRMRYHLLGQARFDNRISALQVVDIFGRAVSRITNPAQWWIDEYITTPTKDMEWMGSFIVSALSQDKTRLGEALALHDEIISRQIHITPSISFFICQQMAIYRIPSARATFHRMLELHPNPPRTSLRRIMHFAARVGWEEEEANAWDLLNEKGVPTIWEKTILASVYAFQGRVELVKKVLGERFPGWRDNAEGLQVLFTAYINNNEAALAEETLFQIDTFSPRLYVYNALLQLYADQGNLIPALELFDRLLEHPTLRPTKHSYTALITLFANRRDPTNAHNVFESMADAGIQPDALAYAAVINAEVEAGDWSEAARSWTKAPAKVREHRTVLSAVLKALVWLPAPTEHVVGIFRRIRNPSRHAWALVIQSACDSGNMDLARELYTEMDVASRRGANPAPDVYTFSILLHGYMRADDSASARAVYDEMTERGILPSSVTYGIVIQSFADTRGARSLEQAHDFATSVYREVQKGKIADVGADKFNTRRNIFTPLAIAHGKLQNWERAQSYFDLIDPTEEPLDPETDNFLAASPQQKIITWSQLMDVHRRAGDVAQVVKIWGDLFRFAIDAIPLVARNESEEADMNRAFGGSNINVPGGGKHSRKRIPESILCIPLSIALDSVSSVGDAKAVRKLWSSVSHYHFGFDAANYNHYAIALARTGDVEGAFRITEKVLMRRFARIKFRGDAAMREKKRDLRRHSRGQLIRPAVSSMDGWDHDVEEIPEEEEEDYEFEEGENEDLRSDPEEMSAVLDLKVDPVIGPPNRRHQYHSSSSPFRPPHLPSSSEHDAKESVLGMEDKMGGEDPVPKTVALLHRWRPRDTLWRPSILLMNVLDSVFGQVEDYGASRGWVSLQEKAPTTPQLEDPEQSPSQPRKKDGFHGTVLPLYGNTPIKDYQTGKPLPISPRAFRVRLEDRYAKAVELVRYFRRRKEERRSD